ncbi:MAG: PAS-domain containing protein [Sulfitobacter sp.]
MTLTNAGLNLIAQALTIYDHDLKLAVCNAPFQQMFDLPDALVTPGATFEDTIRHLALRGEYGEVDDIEAFVGERVDIARAFAPHYMERTRANGRTISVEGSPLPEGGWVTVYTDITRIKQQETLLHARSDALSKQVMAHATELSATNRELAAMITTLEETKRQLTESEARTRLTTEMMPAHIAHVDAQGRYSYSNRRLSSVMPGKPLNILGQHISEVLGDSYARIADALEQAYAGKPSVIEFTDAGSARRIRGAFTPDTRGGVYILSMDVTEETQTREALQQNRKRELAAQTVSGLAHDFANLLTIILGLQSKLDRLPSLPADAGPLIQGTLTAAHRGGALLSSIADVTRPRALRPTATDLVALLSELETLAAPSLPEGVTLRTVNDTAHQPVLLDKGRMLDSLLNLILNARDASGAVGLITVAQRSLHDTWVEWRVCDNGPGFSPSALKHATDPFYTTKGSEGSGLGLSMVYDMTKTAGGDLRLSNDGPDGGAQVTLRLPLRAALPATTGLVLLVEDDDSLRATIRDMLIAQGHSVIEAVGADEATALIADLPDIALVLSDIQLVGEATGLDLAMRIGTTLPLILMTSLPKDHPLFVRAGQIAPVLSKPFDVADMTALVAPVSASTPARNKGLAVK